MKATLNTSKVLAIVGPTASGKSALAVSIAEHVARRALGGFQGAEIVSADSRQVYRGLDIGTGKIAPSEMRGVPHHLLDVRDPMERFTVAEFVEEGGRAIAGIIARGNLPIVCGGTGFYVDALLRGYSFPPSPPDFRAREQYADRGTDELFRELDTLDPARARSVDPHNRRRIERALEIARAGGAPLTPLRASHPYDVLKLGIKIPSAELRARIRERLARRLDADMVEEVRGLLARGVTHERFEELGLEYRFVSRHLRGLLSLSEMTRELERAIWAYARRQMAWFRRDSEIVWITNEREAFECAWEEFVLKKPPRGGL